MQENGPEPIRIEITHHARPASDKRDGNVLEWLRTVVEFAKVLAWPIFAFVMVVWLHEPIFAIIKLIPEQLGAANEVTIASFTVKIDRNAKAHGKPQLAAILTGLSPDAVEQLMKTGRANSIGLLSTTRGRTPPEHSTPNDRDLSVLGELERAGLIQVVRFSENGREQVTDLASFTKLASSMPGASRTTYDESNGWRFPVSPQAEALAEFQYRLTDNGRVAFDSIIKSVAEQLRSESEAAPKSKETK